jgi:hypothetical protein
LIENPKLHQMIDIKHFLFSVWSDWARGCRAQGQTLKSRATGEQVVCENFAERFAEYLAQTAKNVH